MWTRLLRWLRAWGGVLLTLVGGCRGDERPRIPPKPNAVVVDRTARAQKEPRRYAALGASDTQAEGAGSLREGYVFRLFDRLAAQGGSWELYILGWGGARLSDILRWQLPAALAVRPEVITLWTGGNDVIKGVAPEEFAADLDRLLRTLRTETRAHLVLANLPEMHRQPFAAGKSAQERAQLQERVKAFNALIERVAARYRVPVVDLTAGELMYDPANFSPDGIHPNAQGYAGIAARFWQVLEQEMSDRD